MFGDALGELKVNNLYTAVNSPNSSLIAFGTTDSKVYLYDLNTHAQVNAGVLSVAASAYALAFIGTGIVVAWLSNGAPYLLNFSGGGTVNSITTQGLTPQTQYNARHQIMASQISAQQVCGISNTTGQFLCVDNSGGSPVSTKITVASKTFTCIIPKPGTTGTVDGFVYDFTFTGSVNKIITLPTTPVLENSAVHCVGSLSMSASDLIISTNQGFNFHYNYTPSTPTLLETLMVRESTYYGHILSEMVNNQFMHVSASPSFQNYNAVALVSIGTPPNGSMEIDQVYVGYTTPQIFGCGINSNATGYPGYSGVGWLLIPGSASGSSGSDYTTLLKTFGIDGLASVSTTTQALVSGSAVSFRSIRSLYIKTGLSRVESDSTLSSGPQTISLAVDNADYYELALVGSQGVNETADFRKVQA
jgi:hypothetical protein